MTWLLTTIQNQRVTSEPELLHDIAGFEMFPDIRPDDAPRNYGELQHQLNTLEAAREIERIADGWKPVYKPVVPKKERMLF